MKSIKVGLGTCGISAGGELVFDKVNELVESLNLDVEVSETGCNGMCYEEVLLEINDDYDKYLYSKVTPAKVGRIINEHIINNHPVTEWIIKSKEISKEVSFINKQKKIVLRNCGEINPLSIDDYIARKGYEAIRDVIINHSQEDVINIIKKSGLRGRGGGGFSTGMKWEFAFRSDSEKKYIICNADEGDPGAFMDRSVLEGDPHSVIEGMMIAGYAIGADEGIIYIRAEYPLALKRLRVALNKCRENKLLGKSIFGSKFNFDIKIKEGAGAFVCGEETALMASIEGKRGVPRLRPPFPAHKGLYGKPTNINNVETLANIPWIILNGYDAYSELGTEKSKGTKVFALAGKVKKSGLVEVPMGMSINEIIFDIAGGIKNDKKFKAVQIGGPSGGCVPAAMCDLKIDYDEITRTGAIMGSGGLIVLDESTCMVDLAKYFLNFTQIESCGKCTFCRIGTKRMLEILERITEGNGRETDLDLLEMLAQQIKQASLCGLGQTAPNPVLTTIKYFREEYEDHIIRKKCTAHSCATLLTYLIIEDKCNGCQLCLKACPTNAITGIKKQSHEINHELCIKCGKCFDVCRFDAVLKD
ncbi:MAG: NADH-quinone oxidoreductase subunit NuoF [Candidatus Kapabacteria bacterium]|nr:NADH-quinone oxidoreductase subunit NuoF [Candidatus Kapabacteria bacterium]